jgi:hypothetical protein
MKNTTNLDDTLTKEMIRSINKMITSKFSIPLQKYGIEVEDFISNLYVLAYKRGTYDKTKAKVSTYFFWLARTEMSHIRDSKKIKWMFGTPILNEEGSEQIFIEDTNILHNPLLALEEEDTKNNTIETLANHFSCSKESIFKLLDADPKEVMQVSKIICSDERWDATSSKMFMSKVKQARSAGGFSKSR